MGLPKRLSIIENKVKNNQNISIEDELTLIFVGLSVNQKNKEKIVKRVCAVSNQIDYIDGYRRGVIDSLIAFQIENFVTSNDEKEELNEVVSMQLSVEELFLQVEREDQFDRGYEKGIQEGKDEMILKMIAISMDDESIMEFTNCSFKHLQELKNKNLTGN